MCTNQSHDHIARLKVTNCLAMHTRELNWIRAREWSISSIRFEPSLSFFPPLIFLFLFTLFATPNESKTLFWKKSPRHNSSKKRKKNYSFEIFEKSSSHRNEFNRKIDDDHTYDRTRSNNISHPPSVLGRVTFPWKLSHNFLEVVYVYIRVYTHTYIQRFLPVHVYCRER